MPEDNQMMSMLMEAGIAGLQLWFAYCREANLTDAEKAALYAEVDASFMAKIQQELPNA